MYLMGFYERMVRRMNGKAWCCTAAISEGLVTIQQISDGITSEQQENVDDPLSQNHVMERRLDLTSAPDWMEHIEIMEHRQSQSGGAGAYDTMRGDLQIGAAFAKRKWYIWGQDFHLERIQKSFLSLLNEFKNEKELMNDALQRAVGNSNEVLLSLLKEAEQASQLWFLPEFNHSNGIVVYMVRLTLLWSPGDWSDQADDDIIVRGHACSTMLPIALSGPVPAIECSIAAEECHDADGLRTIPIIGASLPSRSHNPQNKVASWTRLRKQLEEPERYKPPGISEVFMVRSMTAVENSGAGPDLEVLEGLSSNVFFVYYDGTLRTPVDGVLHGFVRELVLNCADRCGLKVDLRRPICLREVPQWKEVFITSSSRLVYPVSKIVIKRRLSSEEHSFREFWSDPVYFSTHQVNHEKPKWQEIYETILRQAGY
jgi:Amino-transferase class IV